MSANENTCPLSVSMTTEDPPRDLPLAPKKKKQEAKIAVRTGNDTILFKTGTNQECSKDEHDTFFTALA